MYGPAPYCNYQLYPIWKESVKESMHYDKKMSQSDKNRQNLFYMRQAPWYLIIVLTLKEISPDTFEKSLRTEGTSWYAYMDRWTVLILKSPSGENQ